jgi:hypothetical protein
MTEALRPGSAIFESGEVIAANPEIFDKLARILRKGD